MIGTTHTIRRIATGLTLAAAAAALAVPAALGGAYWPAGGFVTDTVDSARVAAYGPPDPWLYPYIDLGIALAGGVAYATIPGDGGVIQGCYTKVGGIVRVIDTGKGQRCLDIEVPISWNQGPDRRHGPARTQGRHRSTGTGRGSRHAGARGAARSPGHGGRTRPERRIHG